NLNDCILSGNALINGNSFFGGGAILASMSTVTAQRCTFSGNTAAGSNGGAIVVTGSNGLNPLTCIGCTFVNNSAGNSGGAIRGGSPPCILTNSTFVGNSCTDPASQGGAIYSFSNS